ncbi:hypothetical protein FOMPIDRAFT_62406, partial [Fomitopsis schrenkii]
MHSLYSLFIPVLLCLLADHVSGAGNTTCAGSMLDWYTDVVGETPCMTYQRLRQICNSEYEVPSFRSSSPGDNCDDQVSACCCNSIAWALSSLCQNCQWDVDSGSPNGLDALLWRWHQSNVCSSHMAHGALVLISRTSLPADIEEAVCNLGIKLENFLYSLFWNTGSCTYTRETAETDHAANGSN